jgi:hypothetical protein
MMVVPLPLMPATFTCILTDRRRCIGPAHAHDDRNRRPIHRRSHADHRIARRDGGGRSRIESVARATSAIAGNLRAEGDRVGGRSGGDTGGQAGKGKPMTVDTRWVQWPVPGSASDCRPCLNGLPSPSRPPHRSDLSRCRRRTRRNASLPRTAEPAIRTVMSSMRATSKASSARFFAGETLRALSSTLLLLGLIGDRRVR